MDSEGEELSGLTWREKEALLWRSRATRERAERRQAMVDWLAGIRWEWFATFTFGPRKTRSGKRVRPHYSWAKGLLHAALNRLNRVLFGRRWGRRRQGLTVLLCWELHQDGMPHAHALVMGCPAEVDYRWLKEWFREELGISRWYPVVRKRGAIRYITKYCLKEGQDEMWEVLGPTESLPAGPLFDGRVSQG